MERIIPQIVVMTATELETMIQSSFRKVIAEQNNPQSRQFQSHEYLSVEEASEYLHVPKNTLYNYCHNNIIPFYKRRKYNYFLKSDLDEWMASGRKKSSKEMEQDAMLRLQKGGMKK